MNNPPGNYPPKPPPGGPPPMMPPGAGEPGYGPPGAYAAPPPPQKSNTMKWVLIGCGLFAGLGALCCGGFGLMAYFGVKAAINEGMAKVKPIVESNETVKAEIGEVKSMSPRWEAKKTKNDEGHEQVQFTIDVEGTKGKGVLTVDLLEVRDDVVHATLVFKSSAGKATPIGVYELTDKSWKRIDSPTTD